MSTGGGAGIPRRLTPPDREPGTTDQALTYDGRRRPFRVHVPPVVPLGAALVIQLHGGGGNGVGLDRLTGFHRLADRERFVVVSPNGVARRWNDGRTVSDRLVAADDVGFIAALIDALAARLPVDRRRVYVAGISNGAMMAARLATEIPDRIAAYGQVAGSVSADAPTWWHPAVPVPFLTTFGTADPILPYGGGPVPTSRRDPADRGRILAVERWMSLIAAHNGARQADERRIEPDVTVRSWRGPTPQCDVEFWRVDGGGHTWPGGRQYLPVGIIGSTTNSFSATETMWRFFDRHRL